MAHVLVVEDDDLMWRALETYLSRAGHQMSWASTALGAIDELRREAAGTIPALQCVLLDLELHGLMSGVEVARHIPPRIITIVMSGHPREEAILRVERPLENVRLYFSKPFKIEDIALALSRL